MNFTQRLRHALRDRSSERTAARTERYLSQATSPVDLEWREREIDRNAGSGRLLR